MYLKKDIERGSRGKKGTFANRYSETKRQIESQQNNQSEQHLKGRTCIHFQRLRRFVIVRTSSPLLSSCIQFLCLSSVADICRGCNLDKLCPFWMVLGPHRRSKGTVHGKVITGEVRLFTLSLLEL
ncbi:hypothetical protein R1flu_024421 [Riccia fluitans]|uniref:Uncharacterized protein n=1 Tax=Riccia fluitans TaxID=41844 RepID=A0ABD1XUW2_9MARC